VHDVEVALDSLVQLESTRSRIDYGALMTLQRRICV